MQDLIGQRFGKLIIMARNSLNNGKNIFWNCQCDCGNIKVIRNCSLQNGNTKSCGCLKKSKEINLIGEKIGRLLVLSKGESINGRVSWTCQCDCGNIVNYISASLNGGTKSCGCLFKERFLPEFKKCKNPSCIIKPIKEFHTRRKIRKSGYVGSSINEYCKNCNKLRKYISNKILFVLKENKNGESFFNYIGYDLSNLKNHLEKQFEPWMSWNNWGKYNPQNWNDNDSSTWVWNLDHIIPHSTFKYTSMEDQSFKDCWALSNLRPYSAKLNVSEGDRRDIGNIL